MIKSTVLIILKNSRKTHTGMVSSTIYHNEKTKIMIKLYTLQSTVHSISQAKFHNIR